MRCKYIYYKKLYKKRMGIIKLLSKNLIDRANAFYGSNILGINVSDIVYAPNLYFIDEVVLSTIVDIERIRDYHPINNPTRYKYAAYSSFWWLRVKPFMCKLSNLNEMREVAKRLIMPLPTLDTPSSAVLDICKAINEIFVGGLISGMTHIIHNHTSFCDAVRDRAVNLDDMKDSIEYFLRYRCYNAQSLELFLKGLNVCPMGIVPKVSTVKMTDGSR